MGWRDIFRGRATEPVAPLVSTSSTLTERVPLRTEDRWYVPQDGNRERFMSPGGGMPPLHLIRYRDSGNEPVLRLCEDATGLLVGPTDRRLPQAGIYVSQLRGESYHKTACRRGDFSPGTTVRLKREPDNKHDPFAVAITADADDAAVAAYVNKQKAKTLAKLLDQGVELSAVSLRGTPANRPCEQIAVLVARPEVVAHLLSPRPRNLPKPVHQR